MTDLNTSPTPPNPEESPVVTLPRSSFNTIIVAGVFLVLGFILGMVITQQQMNGVSPATRAVINESVAAAMDSQRAIIAEAVSQARPPSLDDPTSRFTVGVQDDPYLGAELPVVEIIEFSDFNCSYCARWANDTLGQIIDNYGDRVRVYYRDYPILSDSSVTAALAAQCANEQGEFWEYHNLLFSNQGRFGRDQLVSYADQLSLNVDDFAACLDEQRYMESVAADYREAQGLGIRGTPAFFINGRPISGAQPYAVFSRIIEEDLAAAAS